MLSKSHEILKREDNSKTFFLLPLSSFLLWFSMERRYIAHQDIQLRRHFLAQFQCGSFWSIFGDFFFLLWMPISPSLTFGLWQQNRHHTPNFPMIDILIFKLVLTFPILAGIQPDQFRDWMDLGRNLVEEEATATTILSGKSSIRGSGVIKSFSHQYHVALPAAFWGSIIRSYCSSKVFTTPVTLPI